MMPIRGGKDRSGILKRSGQRSSSSLNSFGRSQVCGANFTRSSVRLDPSMSCMPASTHKSYCPAPEVGSRRLARRTRCIPLTSSCARGWIMITSKASTLLRGLILKKPPSTWGCQSAGSTREKDFPFDWVKMNSCVSTSPASGAAAVQALNRTSRMYFLITYPRYSGPLRLRSLDEQFLPADLLADRALAGIMRFRRAMLATEVDDLKVEFRPLAFGEELLQVRLGLFNVPAVAQCPAPGQAMDVRIHREGRNAERLHHHHTGGLVAYARQSLQRFHVPGHLAAVLIDQDPAQAMDRLALRR